MNQPGTCRFCNLIKPLIKAHIIPRSFFLKYKGDPAKGQKPYAVLVDSKKPIKESGEFKQAGIYDSNILCESCEKKFGEFDRYGWEILEPITVDTPPSQYNGSVYKIDCDTDKIRRFILSVLWRASVSKIQFYKDVDLGPYERVVKDRIFDPASLLPLTSFRRLQ